MKGEYLSCRSWIDENGLIHPTKDHARQYRDWAPRHYNLDENYQEQIEKILDKRAEETKQKLCYDNNGEPIPEKLKAFADKIEPNLRRQARNKLAKYERHSTRERETNGMNPFTWHLESEDRVREQALGKGRLPRIPKLDPDKLKEKYDTKLPWPGFPKCDVKPEYSGKNHPLEQGQAKRTAKTAETTNIDLAKWNADMPICDRPIQRIEGLTTVFDQVQKQLKTRLDDVDNGVWHEIEPKKLQKRHR